MKSKNVLVITAVALMLAGCSQEEKRSDVVLKIEKKNQPDQRLLELASRHNAIVDWTSVLPDDALFGYLTIDFSRALLRTNDKPTAMEVSLLDLAEKDGVFTADL